TWALGQRPERGKRRTQAQARSLAPVCSRGDLPGGMMIEICHKQTGDVLRSVKAESLVGQFFEGAKLAGANLSKRDLSGCDLQRADLRDADLSNANLSGAMLAGALLRGAVLDG